MPVSGKRKQIEGKLGEPIQAFIGRRLREGRSLSEIGREIGIDRKTVKYYVDKYNIVYFPELIGLPREELPKGQRFLDGHAQGCVCILCSAKDCKDKIMRHKEGRCVLICLAFQGKLTGKLSV